MSIETSIETYFAIWNEPDADKRTELGRTVWTDGARYVDPLSDVAGADGFSAMVGNVQEQFPGHALRLASGLDAHHDQVRFAWEMVTADGNVTIAGLDVAEVDGSGKLRSVAGFFGVAPDPASP